MRINNCAQAARLVAWEQRETALRLTVHRREDATDLQGGWFDVDGAARDVASRDPRRQRRSLEEP